MEDDPGVARLEQRQLERASYYVRLAGTAAEALSALEQDPADLILLDYRLPDESDGLNFYERLQKAGHNIPVILVTAFSNEETVIRALRAGVRDFVSKSVTYLEYLPEAVERVLNQVRIEQALVSSQQKLRQQAQLLDMANDPILMGDLDDRISYWNRSAERLYGWSAAEAQGRRATDLLYRESPVELEQAWCVIRDRGEWSGELRQMTRSGKPVIVASRWTLVRGSDGQPRAILTINTDITEKKRLEGQYLRAQRMESLGTLAGGIAHDLNNLLTPILMASELLRPKCNDADSQTMLDVLHASARRGADMVKQVLTFSRGIGGAKRPLHLGPLINEISCMVQQTFPKSITLKSDVDADLWAVCADPTQMHQAIMNLCLNARDAMPGGGLLSLRAANRTLDDDLVRVNPEATPGPYVVVDVEDPGTGIDPAIIDRIFDPFFTTKELGKGTGLGLSTVLGIVKNHRGFVRVYSDVGKGSRFTVYLPATPQAAEAPVGAGARLLQGNGELVLVIDDEGAIRGVTRALLEAAGYRVLSAADGAEGVSVYTERQRDIQVVLVDLMMPVMDGLSTIRALQKLNPEVRVVAASGLMERSKSVDLVGGVRGFLAKPYTAETLLGAIHGALQGK